MNKRKGGSVAAATADKSGKRVRKVNKNVQAFLGSKETLKEEESDSAESHESTENGLLQNSPPKQPKPKKGTTDPSVSARFLRVEGNVHALRQEMEAHRVSTEQSLNTIVDHVNTNVISTVDELTTQVTALAQEVARLSEQLDMFRQGEVQKTDPDFLPAPLFYHRVNIPCLVGPKVRVWGIHELITEVHREGDSFVREFVRCSEKAIRKDASYGLPGQKWPVSVKVNVGFFSKVLRPTIPRECIERDDIDVVGVQPHMLSARFFDVHWLRHVGVKVVQPLERGEHGFCICCVTGFPVRDLSVVVGGVDDVKELCLRKGQTLLIDRINVDGSVVVLVPITRHAQELLGSMGSSVAFPQAMYHGVPLRAFTATVAREDIVSRPVQLEYRANSWICRCIFDVAVFSKEGVLVSESSIAEDGLASTFPIPADMFSKLG